MAVIGALRHCFRRCLRVVIYRKKLVKLHPFADAPAILPDFFTSTLLLMRKHWWKALTVLILAYVFIAGLISPVPKLPILHEAIRNTFFHPPLWIAMMSLLLASAFYSVRYLRNGNVADDIQAVELANTAILFGVLGCITGSVWAYFAWGDLWPNDPKRTVSPWACCYIWPTLYYAVHSMMTCGGPHFGRIQYFCLCRFYPADPDFATADRFPASGKRRESGFQINTMLTVRSSGLSDRRLSGLLYWVSGLPSSAYASAG